MSDSNHESPKYTHPKILLLDVDSGSSNDLNDIGYNISQGSLGTPYLVEKNSGLFPVHRKHDLPHDFKEHDIVVIDLNINELANWKEFEKIEINRGVNYWWVDHEFGKVNPRLLNGNLIQDDFNRILHTGGVFIVFGADKYVQEFHWGYKATTGGFYPESDSKSVSNWSFLGLTNYTNYFNVGHDHGSVINLSEDLNQNSLLGRFLSGYLEDAKFSCTVGPGYKTEKEWLNLLVNKFCDSVGGVLKPDDIDGYVFIFPDIENKSKFLVEFIHEVLPTITPRLFPEIEDTKWANWPEYELSVVKELNNEIDEVRDEADKKISELQNQIKNEREKNSYLFDLLRATGDDLVEAVIKTLDLLGFENIIDVDEEIKEQEEGQKREDLQILDADTTLIIEVKGISNHPSDEDALTVQKYVILRMREWEETNIKGLSIINSQRHLPPLERENEMPFRNEILENAIEQEIGLLTSWDLHRLARNFIKFDWAHDQIKPLFYKNGRINPVPNHYKYIGTVQRYIDDINVIGVLIKDGSLKINDKIAFELPLFFEEQICESMEFENESIELADQEMLVGIKTHLEKHQAKTDVRVYRVDQN